MSVSHRFHLFVWMLLSVLLTTSPFMASVSGGLIPLSDGSTIVNINARLHGCGSFSGPNPPQPYWHLPTPTAPALTLNPGTYTFRVVNPADAVALYPEITAAQQSTIFTAWTFNSPWVMNYMVFNSTAVGNPTQTQLFDGAQNPTTPGSSLVSPTAAYNYSVSSGYYNKIRPAPPGRSGGPSTFLTDWTFTVPTTLLFVVPDTILSDNGGGVSVLVSAVPEPSAAASFALLVGMFCSRRHRRNSESRS